MNTGPQAGARGDGRVRVLLIEDSPVDAALLEGFLTAHGDERVDIRLVGTWRDALDALRGDKPDAILLDLTLPDTSGFETFEKALVAATSVPILVVTALDDQDLARRTLQHGAQDYLVKEHLDPVRLVRAVEHAIERRRLQSELELQSADLAAREANLRHIVSHSADGMIVLGPDRLALFTNPAASGILEAAPDLAGDGPFPKVTSGGRPRELNLTDKAGRRLVIEIRATDTLWEGTPAQVVTLRDVTERRHHEEERSALLHDLGERLKELTTIHRVAKLLQTGQPTDPSAVLTEIAGILPDAFQWPEIAGAIATFGEIVVERPGPREERGSMAAEFTTTSGQRGALRVFYCEERPPADEGPFLREERHVLDSVAQMVRAHFDRAEALEALARREAHFRLLIENALDVIMALDGSGVIRYGSPSVERVLGYSSSELEGASGLDLLHPEDRPSLELLLAEAVRHPGRPGRLELRMRHRGGSWRILDAVGRAALDAAQAPVVVVNARDVTERKRRELELKAVADMASGLRSADDADAMLAHVVAQLMAAFQASGAAVMGAPLDVNQGPEALGAGRLADADALIDHPLTTQVLASGRPHVSLAESGPEIGGEIHTTIVMPMMSGSQPVGCLWLERPGSLEDHELRLLGALADIAASALQRATVLSTLEHRVIERTRELAAANERLLELDLLKSKFVSDVSHELRTPLTNLMLYLSLLERGRPEKRDAYLAVLQSQARRLGRLIDDILDLSRLDTGAYEPTLVAVDLNAVVRDVIAAHEPRAESSGLTVTLELHDVAAVLGDPAQLSQVVTNLVANALHYTSSGGLRVATERRNGQTVLQVEDSGMGIASEELPHIFDRFYRGQRVGQTGLPGSGLGLSIALEIVERHGGTIVVRSAPNEGSCFTVVLPSMDAENAL